MKKTSKELIQDLVNAEVITESYGLLLQIAIMNEKMDREKEILGDLDKVWKELASKI